MIGSTRTQVLDSLLCEDFDATLYTSQFLVVEQSCIDYMAHGVQSRDTPEGIPILNVHQVVVHRSLSIVVIISVLC